MNTLLQVTPQLGVVVALLVVAAAAVAAVGRLGHTAAIVTAAIRAAVQLAVVSFVIVGAIRFLPAAALFLLLMYGVASVTAGRRIARDRTALWAGLPIACGTVPVLLIMVVSRVVPVTGMALIPITGILLGGCLTATSHAGRRARDELEGRRGEVEAALSLGFSVRDARLEICRPAASQALIPALDQTRTVGLVTLPGAFVGMMLAGAGPVQAGIVQVAVLVALLAAEAVAVVVTIELTARGYFTA
ncbi:ABC transporter permease [Planotetraspora thailandica]|uniref:ABC transporter permease n=1 Tax=Planotetraspora thailandica TaxID=487172 RepID=A0A8J3UXP1_9ACTN|nr:ABC transporter permease [Planotetraspora thailandica]GII53138.1 ABC transporter permease [Planotetraspora thailandica]